MTNCEQLIGLAWVFFMRGLTAYLRLRFIYLKRKRKGRKSTWQKFLHLPKSSYCHVQELQGKKKLKERVAVSGVTVFDRMLLQQIFSLYKWILREGYYCTCCFFKKHKPSSLWLRQRRMEGPVPKKTVVSRRREIHSLFTVILCPLSTHLLPNFRIYKWKTLDKISKRKSISDLRKGKLLKKNTRNLFAISEQFSTNV